MLSFWEKESFLTYDLVVLGGGIVGLSTALSFKEKSPHSSVLVLERGVFPTGASTKNAGFACYGSAAEIWHDLQQLGEDRAMEVVELRVTGLQKLRARLGDEAMGYEEHGGGEIFLKDEYFDQSVLPHLNQLLFPFFKKDVFVPEPDRVGALGFQTESIQAFITNTVEGQIDTGKMMRSLLSLARQKGVEILTGCRAELPEYINGFWQIPVADSGVVFSAERVAVCTNAFTTQLFPELDIKPGRGQVLITKPIPGLKFKGIFHFDEGYYYFRNVGERVLFGGGRNLDFKGEETYELGLQSLIQDKLEYYLQHLILPPGQPFAIEHRWAGIMAFGTEKVPVIQNCGNGLVMGVRMNGMGVAMGTEVGERLAGMLA
ncbi:MAG TPA: FAD-dependent oxidoreductase [Catalimonadaceae bacterium]|nr:FAD-dependent oxidoreductase [Catalimonadaceae bacterium]